MSTLQIKNLHDLAAVIRDQGVPVHGAPALGIPVASNGQLGADLLHVKAGDRFPIHVHPGDHLLICAAGKGTISVGGITYHVRPGDAYMVDGLVPHAVGAADDEDHILLSVGSPHVPVASPGRMTATDWHGHAVETPQYAG